MIKNLRDAHIKNIEENITDMKIKKNKVIVGDGRFEVPSQLFPLTSNKIEVFYHNNTWQPTSEIYHTEESKADLQLLTDCFNNVEAQLGRCYTNIRNFYELALKGDLKGKLKTYVGWVKIGSSNRLIHHCWAVYNNVHLIDFGASHLDFKLELEMMEKNLSIDEMRELLAENYVKNKEKLNSEVYTIGRTVPNHFYIGCECEPYKGIEVYNELMDNFPNHPSYLHNNSDGSSKLQKMILEKM